MCPCSTRRLLRKLRASVYRHTRPQPGRALQGTTPLARRRHLSTSARSPFGPPQEPATTRRRLVAASEGLPLALCARHARAAGERRRQAGWASSGARRRRRPRPSRWPRTTISSGKINVSIPMTRKRMVSPVSPGGGQPQVIMGQPQVVQGGQPPVIMGQPQVVHGGQPPVIMGQPQVVQGGQPPVIVQGAPSKLAEF